MFKHEDVRLLHLEITTRCNANCPLCSRNILGGKVAPGLPLVEMQLADVQRILPRDFVRQLDMIYLCGNHGDPIVASDTLEVLAYFRSCNPAIRLGIYTNGSARDKEFWRRLAGLADYCRFGIDGLEDTNHLYRRGTQWSKILASIDAYVSAGGRAEWDYIVFRHNEHQVEKARHLSEQLGFSQFSAKRTARFIHPHTGKRINEIGVLDRKGRFEYYIEEPSTAQYRNPAVQRLYDRSAHDSGYSTYLCETPIVCKSVATKSIYVSAEGEVFPCCWVGMLYRWYSNTTVAHVLSLIENTLGGRGKIDGRSWDIRGIIDGKLFQELIPNAWMQGQIGSERLEVCARVCGREDIYAAQFANYG